MNEQTQSPHEDYNVDFSDILAEVATEAPVLDDASNEASPADTTAGFAAVRSHYMQQATEHILALHNDASLNLAEMNLRFSTAINLNRMENTRVCIIGVGGIGTWLVRCLVGMGSLVMDGAVLRSGVLLAAGSLVSPGKELHGGWLWAGRPTKPVRELRAEEMEFFVHSAAHYAELKNAYRGA